MCESGLPRQAPSLARQLTGYFCHVLGKNDIGVGEQYTQKDNLTRFFAPRMLECPNTRQFVVNCSVKKTTLLLRVD